MSNKRNRFSRAFSLILLAAGAASLLLSHLAAAGSLDGKITGYIMRFFEAASFSLHGAAIYSFGLFLILEGFIVLLFRKKKRASMVISVPYLVLLYGTLLIYTHLLGGIDSPAFLMANVEKDRNMIVLVCILLELLLYVALLFLLAPLDRKIAKRSEFRIRQDEYKAENTEDARTAIKDEDDARKYLKKMAREEKKAQRKALKAERKAKRQKSAEEEGEEAEETFTTPGAVFIPREPVRPEDPVSFPDFEDIPELHTIKPGNRGAELLSDTMMEGIRPSAPLRETRVFETIKEEVERQPEPEPEPEPERVHYDFSSAQTFSKGGMLEATIEAMSRNTGNTVLPPKKPIIGYDDVKEEKPKTTGSIAPSGLSPDHPRYKLFEALQRKPGVSRFPSRSFSAEEPDARKDESAVQHAHREEAPAPIAEKPVEKQESAVFFQDEEDDVFRQPAPKKEIHQAPPVFREEAPKTAPEPKEEYIPQPEDEDIHEQENELLLTVGIGGLQSNEMGLAAINRRKRIKYLAPPSDFLVDYPEVSAEIDEETRKRGDVIIDVLRQFHVEATLDSIVKGPTVTMYQINPAEGTPVQKITQRETDLSYNLEGANIRILAPVPGKRAVGIEVPNAKRAVIGFKDMLREYGRNKDFQKMRIPMILGRTITGEPIVYDVAKAPHMLIAGSTGSGKSVCINSFICTGIYTRSPRDLRFIMIDPKVVELSVYNGIPHLLTPVITDAKKVVKALMWLCDEMDRRYKMLSKFGVRNIEGLNEKIKSENIAAEKLPYIVLIMDEFADLMAVVAKEIELYVSRLAAKARAAGIHLILATQRPSSDVVTGTIKNNFPARIAFAVSSSVNSRIIIDELGAESLLGKGDMLLLDSSKPGTQRIQGAFLSDSEVDAIVSYEKRNSTTDYLAEDIFEDAPENDESSDEYFDEGDSDDDLYQRAKEICYEKKVASASFLQRRMKIGYNRAARLIDRMEEEGIIGPPNGSKPREIICFK